MTDETRNEAGQFASGDLPLGGDTLAADLGYKKMPEAEQDRPEPESNIRAEAQKLAASRIPEDPIVPLEYQRNATGEKSPENETVTLERAADDLSAYHGVQDVERARSISSDFSKEIDAMRADALKENPELAKDLGLSKDDVAAAAEAAKAEAEVETAVKTPVEPTTEADVYADIPGLEPATREALKQPQVRQFLEQAVAETDQVKQSYSQGLNHAQQFAQASLVALAPELAQVPIEIWADAVNIIAQSDPARGQQLGRVFQNVAALQQAQQQTHAYQQQAARQQLEQYGRAEDAKFRAMVPQMSSSESLEFGNDLVSYANELGVTKDQLVYELQNNPAMRHAGFQKMVYDAIQYRRIQKAPKAVARKDLPPVQKPGTSSYRSSSDNSAEVASLRRQISGLTGDKAVRAAAKLAQLQRKG